MPNQCPLDRLFAGAVTVGGRRQVVVPARIRRELGIVPGDHLLVFAGSRRASIMLVKVEGIGAFREALGTGPRAQPTDAGMGEAMDR
jgi:AbrB family looped-hinge helix DNA binding protein